MIRLRIAVASVAALLLVALGVFGSPAAPAAPIAPAALIAPAAPTGAATTSVPQQFDPATVERLDAAITDTMERTGIPGVSVGVWIPGRGTYEKSFGVSDTSTGTPMKTDMHMRIGSVTKTFTVTGLLQLVDQRKVGLDDLIDKYVPGVPQGGHISLRELAEMRSGLFNYTDDEKWEQSLRDDPQRSYTPQELLDYSFAHRLNFPPGSKWQYSNTNTVLLGLVIEKVSGQPLGAYLEEHVYAPLKLQQTSLPTNAALPEPYAHGYTDDTQPGAPTATATGDTVDATHWDPSWAWAAGAMVSTLDDLHTWVPALVDGRLLKPATQKQRLAFGPTGIPNVSYGLGVMRVNGWIGHNGELPGYETLAVQLPGQQATLVILINSDDDYRGQSLSTLMGRAVTSVVTPDNVFDIPSAPQSPTTSPSAS
ncbi:serine hydrolase domain-containing protein [Streptomyces sp. NPDC059175]|uniref:serine hydrolase domain-containing protein n=1 Tax=Streptomyces sp. NPDC059175 TaxID=3346757 RepID=UPI0036AE4B22